MNEPECFVGIDVSKLKLDCAIGEDGELLEFANSEAALPQLVERLQRFEPSLIVLEASGGYERLAVAHLGAGGLPVVVVNPRQVRAYAKACGVWAKTDAIDARLLARLPELGRLDRKQIASLAGLAPIARDSGSHRGKRHIAAGQAQILSALYMAVVSAIRCNAQIKDFYARLRAAGKPPKVALTACMRKLLTILNAMVRTNTEWDEHLFASV